jgi:putative transposase
MRASGESSLGYCQIKASIFIESRKHRSFGDTFYIDEVFVKINGKQHYLWRAVDQDGEVAQAIRSESP